MGSAQSNQVIVQLFRTADLGFEYIIFIHFRKAGPVLKFSSVINRSPHLVHSNVFSASRETIIPGWSSEWVDYIMLNVKTPHTEKVWPPNIKLVWSWLIIKDIIFFPGQRVSAFVIYLFFLIIAPYKADWPIRLTQVFYPFLAALKLWLLWETVPTSHLKMFSHTLILTFWVSLSANVLIGSFLIGWLCWHGKQRRGC